MMSMFNCGVLLMMASFITGFGVKGTTDGIILWACWLRICDSWDMVYRIHGDRDGGNPSADLRSINSTHKSSSTLTLQDKSRNIKFSVPVFLAMGFVVLPL
jgi:hypothetical protein